MMCFRCLEYGGIKLDFTILGGTSRKFSTYQVEAQEQAFHPSIVSTLRLETLWTYADFGENGVFGYFHKKTSPGYLFKWMEIFLVLGLFAWISSVGMCKKKFPQKLF